MKPAKPSAASRTVGMFVEPTATIDDRPIEAPEDDAKEARVPMEQDVDRNRQESFKFQEWVSKHFAEKDASEDEYRISKKGEYYLVETLRSLPGTPNYGSSGIFVHQRNLYNLTAVLVQAVRAKQAEKK